MSHSPYEGPISTTQIEQMYQKLPPNFDYDIFNQDFSTILNEGYLDLQGMMIHE